MPSNVIPTGLPQKEFNRKAHAYLAQLRKNREARRFALAEFARLAPLPPAARLG